MCIASLKNTDVSVKCWELADRVHKSTCPTLLCGFFFVFLFVFCFDTVTVFHQRQRSKLDTGIVKQSVLQNSRQQFVDRLCQFESKLYASI